MPHYNLSSVEIEAPRSALGGGQEGVGPQCFLQYLARGERLPSERFPSCRAGPLSRESRVLFGLLLSASIDISRLLAASALRLGSMRQKEIPESSPLCFLSPEAPAGLLSPHRAAFCGSGCAWPPAFPATLSQGTRTRTSTPASQKQKWRVRASPVIC